MAGVAVGATVLNTRKFAFRCLNDWRLSISAEHVEILIEVAEFPECGIRFVVLTTQRYRSKSTSVLPVPAAERDPGRDVAHCPSCPRI